MLDVQSLLERAKVEADAVFADHILRDMIIAAREVLVTRNTGTGLNFLPAVRLTSDGEVLFSVTAMKDKRTCGEGPWRRNLLQAYIDAPKSPKVEEYPFVPVVKFVMGDKDDSDCCGQAR